MASVKGQCHTLPGRLEVLGPGTAAAAGRRRGAQVQEQRQAMLLSERQGRSIIQRGFAKLLVVLCRAMCDRKIVGEHFVVSVAVKIRATIYFSILMKLPL